MKKMVEKQITGLGEPTDYIFSGCREPLKPSAFEDMKSMTMNFGMTVDKCFIHCAKKAKDGAKYFGIARGRWCFCSGIPEGEIADKSKCNVKCDGKPLPGKMCGGDLGAASVYTMIDCIPETASEKANKAALKKRKLMNSFGVFENESCGEAKGNVAELDGSKVLSGSVEECKKKCWEAMGSEKCHGFTYDPLMQSCKFVMDVTDGVVKKKHGLMCYWKKQ